MRRDAHEIQARSRLVRRGSVRGIRVYETTGTADADRAEEYRARREAQLWDRSVTGERGTHPFGEAVLIYLRIASPWPVLQMRTLAAPRRPLRAVAGQQHHTSGRRPSPYPSITPDQRRARVIKASRHAADGGPSCRGETGLVRHRRLSSGRRSEGITTRWLTRDEAKQLIAECAPHLKPIIAFLLHTGARLGEALRLQWPEVDLQARRVVFVQTKNGESRGVPLNDEVFISLANLPHRKDTCS